MILAVWNQKGGSGKSTTAVNLSAVLSEEGYNTLLVDLDRSEDATEFFPPSPYKDNVSDFFFQTAPFANIAFNPHPRLWLIPGSSAMDDTNALWNNYPSHKEQVLSDAFDEARKSPLWNFDVVILDVPGRWGLVPQNALLCATHHLVPISPDRMAIQNAVDTESLAQKFYQRARMTDPERAFLLTKIDQSAGALAVATTTALQWPTQTLNTQMRDSKRYSSMSLNRETVCVYPTSKAYFDFQALVTEFKSKKWL